MTVGVRALGEVLGLEARLLGALPLPTTLVCSLVHGTGRVVVTVKNAPLSGVQAGQAAVFVGLEVDALVWAAELGRATHVQLAQWHAWKLADRRWRLELDEALGGLRGTYPVRGWTVGQVFRATGIRLDEVRA